jgi:hypothetical protein
MIDVSRQINEIVATFVEQIGDLARRSALAKLKHAFLPVSLETERQIDKKVKNLKKEITKKTTKKATKAVKETAKSVKKKVTKATDGGKNQRKRDARRAHKIRTTQGEGKNVSEDDLRFIEKYNAEHPVQQKAA